MVDDVASMFELSDPYHVVILEVQHALGVLHHGVAAQVEIESKTCKHFIIFQFQALSSRCFERGFDRVNLHRPTMALASEAK